jgi:hypothetical protein
LQNPRRLSPPPIGCCHQPRPRFEAGASVHELKPGSDVAIALGDVVALLGLELPGRGLLTRLAGRR